MLEKIQDWYFEQLKGWIPAHRVAAAIIAFTLLSSSRENAYLSTLESFLRLNLAKLTFENGSVFENSTILDATTSVVLVFLAFLTSTSISKRLLKSLQMSAAIQSKIRESIVSAESKINIDEDIKKAAKEETSEILSKNKKLISIPFSASELSFCLAFTLSATAPNLGALDFASIFFFFLFGAILAYRSVFNYIHKNLRYLILESALTGKPLRFD